MHALLRDLMLQAAVSGAPVVYEVLEPLRDLYPSVGSYVVMRPAGERLVTVERAVSEREFMTLMSQDPLALRPLSPSAAAFSDAALGGLPWRLGGVPRLPPDRRPLLRLEP